MIDVDKIEKRKGEILTAGIIAKGDDYFFKYSNIRYDENLIESFLKEHPENKDENIIIQKIRLIDLLNSTNLKMYNIKEEGAEKIEKALAKGISEKSNLDELIADGDSEAVEYIAYAAKGRDKRFPRLYSFASKYCYYHQMYAFKTLKKNYPIYDKAVREKLPLYLSGFEADDLEKMFRDSSKKDKPYEKYRVIIDKVFEKYKINMKDSKFQNRPYSMLDHFLWHKYKTGN